VADTTEMLDDEMLDDAMINPVTGEIIDQKELAERLLAQAKEQGARALTPHVLVLPDADHGLFIPGPLNPSAQNISARATATERFLDENVVTAWREHQGESPVSDLLTLPLIPRWS